MEDYRFAKRGKGLKDRFANREGEVRWWVGGKREAVDRRAKGSSKLMEKVRLWMDAQRHALDKCAKVGSG